MIGYAALGTNDITRAAKFYDELLGKLGATRGLEAENFIIWGTGEGAPFGIFIPTDGKLATVGNGNVLALKVESTAKVDEMYAAAIALGATDEGAPGERMSGFYAGYFRDLDGNKLNFHCFG